MKTIEFESSQEKWEVEHLDHEGKEEDTTITDAWDAIWDEKEVTI